MMQDDIIAVASRIGGGKLLPDQRQQRRVGEMEQHGAQAEDN
jgi:hypothetical protein